MQSIIRVKNAIGVCFLLAAIIGTQRAAAQVVINEYSCSNMSTITNSYGNYEDWVELYNTGGAAVSLSGYYLSDDPTNISKWQVPAGVTINAGGRMMVYCDNMDSYNGGELHTSFKLNQTYGEKIILANSAGTVIDSSSLYLTQNGHSRGRTSDGAATWALFPNPTPNAANSGGKTAYEPKVIFSVAAGFYTTTQSVSLSCSDATAQIRYTTNGQAPTAASTLYSGTAISITTTTLVRAAAFPTNSQYLRGFDENNTYFINETVAPTMNIISVGGDYATMFNGPNWDGNFLLGSFEFFDKNQQFKFELEGEAQPHGNDSWNGNAEEKGFSFHAQDQMGYDADMRYKFFNNSNRDTFGVVILKTGASDAYPGYHPESACHLRDVFAETLSMKYGLHMDARKYEPAVLYINGQYWGIYEIRERVDDPDYTEYYYGQKESKIDFLEYWGGLNVKYGSDTAWYNLDNFMQNNDLSIAANYQHVTDRLDVMSFIDYTILNTYLEDSDWLNWNTMWWRGRKGAGVKWKYALWDEDNIFNLGETFSVSDPSFNGSPCDAMSNFQNDPQITHTRMFAELNTNPTFKQTYQNRYIELINNVLNCDTLSAHLNSILAIIQPEMQHHCNRWSASYTQWQANVDSLRAQIAGRCSVIEDKIDSCFSIKTATLQLNVAPVGAGTIKINGSTKSPYLWQELMSADSTYTLQAIPATGNYVFDHWEKQQVLNTVTPNMTASGIQYGFHKDDSVVAVFRYFNPDSLNVSFKVSPVGGGTIAFQGTPLPYYPYTTMLNRTNQYGLAATPSTGWQFLYWGKQQTTTTYTPNDQVPAVQFGYSAIDTLTAYFQYNPDSFAMTFDVLPAGAGSILLDNNTLPTYPYITTLDRRHSYTLSAVPDAVHRFVSWSSNGAVGTQLTPDTLQQTGVTLQFIGSDKVVAHFRPIDSLDETVTLPTAFTPNGDGRNDYFFIISGKDVVGVNLRITNRWGEVVYSTNDRNFKWDGTRHGTLLDLGTYNYLLDVDLKNSDGVKGHRRLAGDVTLIW